MAKFLKFAIAPSVDSGTTDGVPSGANDLIDSGQNFLTTVSVGDLVHDTSNGVWYKVSAVVDNDNLTLESGTIATGQNYTIYSGTASDYNYQLVLADNIVIVEQQTASATTIYYTAGGTSTDIIVITHAKLANGTDTDVRDAVQDALLDLYSVRTRPDAYKLVSMPTDIIVTGIAVT